METELATRLLEHLQEPVVILAVAVIVLCGWITKSSSSRASERHREALERQSLQTDNNEKFQALEHMCKDNQELLDKAFTTLSLLISPGRGHGKD